MRGRNGNLTPEELWKLKIEHRLTRVEVLLYVVLALSFAHLAIPGLP